MQRVNPDNLWSIEAEAAVLGSMIYDSECIGGILPILNEKSFFKPEHQTIYNILVKLYIESDPIDAIALRTELKKSNQLEAIGGVVYIAKLLNSVPSAANSLYYARIVKDRQRFRDMVRVVEKIGDIPSEPLSVDEQMQHIQEIALNLEQDVQDKEFYTFHDCSEEAGTQSLNQVYKTGFNNIDRIINGVTLGELVIIAGRPGSGKSALALQIARHFAKSGLSVVFFTLEMTHTSLFERATKDLEAHSLQNLDIVLHEMANTPDKQLAFVKTRKQTHKVDVIFIDYLQLMSAGQRSESRVQEVTTISRKLKRMAMAERVPVIALSQLNRQVESRDKHIPRMSDLRESGSIEQDADIVMLLNREDLYRPQDDSKKEPDGAAKLFIAKNRRGPTGIADLVFLDVQVKFGDMAKEKNFPERLI